MTETLFCIFVSKFFSLSPLTFPSFYSGCVPHSIISSELCKCCARGSFLYEKLPMSPKFDSDIWNEIQKFSPTWSVKLFEWCLSAWVRSESQSVNFFEDGSNVDSCKWIIWSNPKTVQWLSVFGMCCRS